MPELRHTRPCGQCPWRRESAPGWLGSSSPEEFLFTTNSEAPMPCHCAIDYTDPDWKSTQFPSAPLCAGALVFLKNSCKSPRDPELNKAVKSVSADPEAVFQWGHEFLEHHNQMRRS